MKTLLLVIALFITPYLMNAQWQGTFDGNNDPARLFTYGDNILTITSAYIWDNGEGESPQGEGSDWGWWGPFPKKHGPYGNMHLLVYAPDQETILVHTFLHGPWKTGENKWEWLDNEGVDYINYGIYDWDSFSFDKVFILIYESDPSSWIGITVPEWLSGREDDVLIYFWVNKSDSYCGLAFENYYVPKIEVKTVDLNFSGETWSNQSILRVRNTTNLTINIYVKAFTVFSNNSWGWTDWIGPFTIQYYDKDFYTLTEINDDWIIRGKFLYIYAESADGDSFWTRDKGQYISIQDKCDRPTSELRYYDYTFE